MENSNNKKRKNNIKKGYDFKKNLKKNRDNSNYNNEKNSFSNLKKDTKINMNKTFSTKTVNPLESNIKEKTTFVNKINNDDLEFLNNLFNNNSSQSDRVISNPKKNYLNKKNIAKNQKKARLKLDRILILILIFLAFVILIDIFIYNISNEKKSNFTNNSKSFINIQYTEFVNKIIIDTNYDKTKSSYYQKYLNENTKFDFNVIDIINDKYFIESNYTRYLEYLKDNNLNSRSIVENVNCNLDKEYYTSVENSDLSKKKLLLVNKYNNLKTNYIPKKLVKINKKYGNSTRYLNKEAYSQFKKMYSAAKKEKYNLYIVSGYRSYNYQTTLYNSYVKSNGKKEAERFSARPGYSEHQTGLAIDVSNGKSSFNNFENTKEFKWMKENSYKYGFILRYPENKEKQTGYMYEPWHYRYLGVEVATKVYKSGLTYDEYYEIFIKK